MAFKSNRKSRRHRVPRQEQSAEKDAFFQPLEPKNPVAIQPKLTVGAPDDKYEHEADRVADQVVSGKGDGQTPAIQSKADSRMEKDREIQEKPDKGARPQVQRMVKGEEEPVQAKSAEEEEPLQAMTEEEEPVQAKSAEEEEPVQAMTEEEEPVQAKSAEEEEPVQAMTEEEEPVQAKSAEEEEPLQAMTEEEEPVQAKSAEEEEPVQAMTEEEEPVQAKSAEEEEPVQAKAQSSSSTRPDLAGRLRSRAGKGRPLTEKTRAKMEAGFGRDFTDVNIHTDAAADEMNRELGARAFARGQDVYFKSGEFNPDTAAGQRLLAHELTHTVQQGGAGKTAKTDSPAVQRKWDRTQTLHPLNGNNLEIDVHLKFAGAVLNKSANANLDTAGLARAAKRQIENSFQGKVKKKVMHFNIVFNIKTTATIRAISSLSALSFGKEHIFVVLDESHPKVKGNYGTGPFYGTIVYLNEKFTPGMIADTDVNTIPHEVGHTAGLKHLIEEGEESSWIGSIIKNHHHLANKDNMMWRGGGHPSYSAVESDQKLNKMSEQQLGQVDANVKSGKVSKLKWISYLDLLNLK